MCQHLADSYYIRECCKRGGCSLFVVVFCKSVQWNDNIV